MIASIGVLACSAQRPSLTAARGALEVPAPPEQVEARVAHTPLAQRASLELVRVDDLDDRFANLRPEELARCGGLSIQSETVSVGPEKSQATHFAQLELNPGETPRAGADRFRAWLSAFPLPASKRFGIEQFAAQADDDAPIRLRTYLLVGASDISVADVTDVKVLAETFDEPRTRVNVVLSSAAAARFEAVTREWTRRRLAILVAGEVLSVPVILGAISGGSIQIVIGDGPAERQLANAHALERGLLGR